jgi:hypothetical protein
MGRARSRRNCQRDPEPDRELAEFKALLGSAAEPYSDNELRQLRREMFVMAELLLDIYLDKKRQTRRQERRRF